MDKLFATSFVAHKKDDAEKIFYGKMKFAWERLPEEIRNLYNVIKETTEDFKIDLGGKHINEMQVSVSVRSGTSQRIHISELSYVDKNNPGKSEEIMRGAIPALAAGGMLTIESTARGLDGHFYNIFNKAWEKDSSRVLNENEYKAHFYNWTWDDYLMSKVTDEVIERDKNLIPFWLEDYAKKHNLTLKEKMCYYGLWLKCDEDMEFLKQEYPTTVQEAFEGSVKNLFKIESVNRLPEKKGRIDGNWTYYKDYIPGNVYGLGADVAEGVQKDSSTCAIWDFTPLFRKCDYKPEVVATYASDRVSPTEFAYVIVGGARMYGNCLVAPELNNHGHATVAKLREIYPENLIFNLNMDALSPKEATEGRFGFLQTTATKSIIMNELNDAVNQELINIWSEVIKKEMISYDKDNVNEVRKKKDQTKHWDLLIATAIGYQMRRYVKYDRPQVETPSTETNNDPYE